MIGDTIIFKKIHHQKADLILEYLKNKSLNKSIIAIAGESGTGKSEIAFSLQKKLYLNKDLKSTVIQLDDYYLTHWNNRRAVRKEKGIDYIGQNEIDWTKINRIINSFKKEECENYLQQIHRWTDQVEKVIINNTNIDVFIIEGLYAIYLKSLADHRIYLSGTSKDTLNFRKERKKEIIDEFRLQVLEKEGYVVRASKQWADLSISFNGKFEEI